LLLALLLASCASRPSAPVARSSAAGARHTLGETRTSRAIDTKFRRASGSPLAVAAVYYNVRAGIAAMSAGAAP